MDDQELIELATAFLQASIKEGMTIWTVKRTRERGTKRAVIDLYVIHEYEPDLNEQPRLRRITPSVARFLGLKLDLVSSCILEPFDHAYTYAGDLTVEHLSRVMFDRADALRNEVI